MRSTPRFFGQLTGIVSVLAFGFPGNAADHRRGNVAVEVAEPALAYHTYPPGEFPQETVGLGLTGEEAGLCHTRLNAAALLYAEYPLSAIKHPVIKIKSVVFKIGITITIWAEEESPKGVLEHENAHRAISEHYYRLAQDLARELGEKTVDRELTLPKRADEPTVLAALEPIQSSLLDEFTQSIDRRIRFAQERFDAITDHGRNNVTNLAAIGQAITEEEAHLIDQNASDANTR